MPATFLFVSAGDAAGSRIALGEELIIGRSSVGEGMLGGDPEISRRHARLSWSVDGRLLIEDLGSTNGTLVNGEPIDDSRVLDIGDVVRLGRTTLEVRTGPDGAGGPSDGAAPSVPVATRVLPATEESRASDRAAAPLEQAGSPSALHPVPPPARRDAPAPPAALLHAGRRVPIAPGGVTIGRQEDNDVVVDAELASRRHARVAARDGRWFVADLDTLNGTRLNGERLRDEARWLNAGDTITVGGEQLRFLLGEETRFGEVPEPVAAPRRVRFEGRRMTIGRDPSNDVVLDDPNVSRFHAEVVAGDGGAELRDLGSRNGTRLDGRLTAGAALRAGSELGVGPFRLVFDGASFVRRDDRGALRMDAEDLTMTIKGKTILKQASIRIQPGEMVVIIGESGSGKSTMIKALAGVTTPSAGTVTVNGEPVASRLTDIGYVPQDEIVHPHLTVSEALRYSAKLRLPRDSTAADIDGALERVLAELSLEEHADTQIGSLSGGQRKRAGLASELLNRPSLLFLDEPTTGLDPGLETRMMELFRELAEPGTRAVAVVTHATKNLGIADKICVMGRGGDLSFFGTPEDSRRFFGVDTYDGIYTALDERPAIEWRREFERSESFEPAGAPAAARSEPAPRAARPRAGPQAAVLARRYLKLLMRDRRNLAILLGQVPVIALGIALLFKGGVLERSRGGRPGDAAQLLFLLVTTSLWLGSIDGSREIIKERALADREAAVGVRLSAYLTSKAVVLFGLVAVQVTLLALIVFAMRPLHEPTGVLLVVLGTLMLTGFIAVGQGLLISASVNTEDQATSFIPLVLIPQLLFAGAIVSVKNMGEPVHTLSNAVFARWSFADVGTAIGMNDRIAGDRQFAKLSQYGHDFFAIGTATGVLVLVAFLVAFFGGVVVMLRRRSGR